MKVLMIHNRYRATGGEDTSTDAQVELLRHTGHEVTLLEDSNYRIERLGRVRTAARSVWSKDAHRRVERVLEGGQFDVLHVQNHFPLFSPSVYYAARKARVPVVQSLRNFRLVCPQGMLHRDGGTCTDCVGRRVAWPGVIHRCYQESAAATGAVAVMVSLHRGAGTWTRTVDKYVTPSEDAKTTYVAGGWDPASVDVIPNFVFPDPGPGSGDGGFALYAGRLAPSKGLNILVEAWRRGRIEIPLRIVGEGPLKSYVREAAAANPNVTYDGVVDSSRVSELLGQASFAVIPTTGVETFGRVAIEALARGTPSIAASHGGLTETVRHTETGLLFSRGDVGELISAVRELGSDPERRTKMRRAARQDFVERFNGDRALDQWLNLYASVANERR